ncbi:uncharacterized protein BYT42DRAFT_497885 [Radiomyces spectabilis]|uniref:uncharacterized protein n=1 Tax=Radiomyces spectabilis TaxID=64574 RepID=UPI00221E8951|nr:uncharacterized protein BYT42DRAFT_497885 [Radiomyces spectabilis]KAI8376235.1 hypothetical protein BYT42DRAFT_497885 [Radiomyces spectabilis]
MAAVTTENKPKDVKEAIGGVVDTVNKRVSGKAWKIQKTPTVRAQKAKTLRRSWEQRTAERTRIQAVKALEKQLKDERQAEKDVGFPYKSRLVFYFFSLNSLLSMK